MKTILLAMTLASSVLAGTITLTMDEVANQPINGLTVSKGGENFTFSNPSGTLFYNSNGPGIETFVQDPSIQGSTAPFGVAFSTAVNRIQFGLAEGSFSPVAPLATVDLYFNSVVPFASISFDSSLVDLFAEGQFNYDGAPVTEIVITPNAAQTALSFDNLTVNTVPEPTTLSMLAGVAVLTVAKTLKKKRGRQQSL